MKKRMIVLALSGVFLLSGCGKEAKLQPENVPKQEETAKEPVNKDEEKTEEKEPETTETIFSELSDWEFYFASGAGGWCTVLYIDEDGSFRGNFHDSDMGSTGEGYPQGTIYYSDFSGQFTTPVKVDTYTYQFELESIEYENPLGTEKIIDETLYVYTDAYGLAESETFDLYLPGHPLKELPEEYLSWVGYYDLENTGETDLPFYGLYNEKPQNGFSSSRYLTPYEQAMESIQQAQIAVDLWEDRLEKEDLSQAEMNEISGNIYTEWDNVLNEIWGMIKYRLPEAEFQKLLEEQRSWIKEKDAKVAEVTAECGGGSIAPLVANDEAARLTRERIDQLLEYLK